jgi:hypothetical protein
MAKMNDKTRTQIVKACKKHGFSVLLKPDGSDNYTKNLMFRSGEYKSDIFIHRDTGINTTGDMSYLKIAVHPSHFNSTVIDPAAGIEDFINNQTKINQHFSSNYIDFPTQHGKAEPHGKCYKVNGILSLERLLFGLIKA